VVGKLFHSGLPHKGINSIEMGMDAMNYIQRRFYADFPRHPREIEYNYATPSTLKPTQIRCTPGALNQLPPECIIEGDIRLAPFYDIKKVREAVDSYVADINADPSIVSSEGEHGAHAKYVLPDEDKQGRVELTWMGDGENGIACNLDSVGYKALLAATESVLGKCTPYSIGGSLPLVRELQDSGYDVQISGYGFSSRYHADNEAVSLASMKQATKIILNIIGGLQKNT
jgi:acetylornithine deacetylase